MEKRNIIVIGASAGGLEAIRKLIAGLPPDMDAAIFVVWHMAPDVIGILPQLINGNSQLPAGHAIEGEAVEMGRVYIAPPDHHMLIDDGKIRVTHGPKENRFRPAIDPLFRSAAQAFGPRVIGVILTGALDDGTAGLWTVKEFGGLALVQDPKDAEVPSMPEHAIKDVKVDYVVPLRDMPALLVKLSAEPINGAFTPALAEKEKNHIEVRIAMQEGTINHEWQKFAEPSLFTCPECHGVLSQVREGGHIRFRCHTGHAFSADSLLASLTESIENSYWTAIRSVQESIFLLNQMGDHFAERNRPKIAAMYFRKAMEAEGRAEIMRQVVFDHEQLTTDNLERQAGEENIVPGN